MIWKGGAHVVTGSFFAKQRHARMDKSAATKLLSSGAKLAMQARRRRGLQDRVVQLRFILCGRTHGSTRSVDVQAFAKVVVHE